MLRTGALFEPVSVSVPRLVCPSVLKKLIQWCPIIEFGRNQLLSPCRSIMRYQTTNTSRDTTHTPPPTDRSSAFLTASNVNGISNSGANSTEVFFTTSCRNKSMLCNVENRQLKLDRIVSSVARNFDGQLPRRTVFINNFAARRPCGN